VTPWCRRSLIAVGLLLVLMVVLWGCGMKTDFYRELETSLAAKNYEVALRTLQGQEEEYGEKNVVLYNLEMGTLTHYGARYEESNRYFLAAEKTMEELYTKSITTEAAAVVLNDNLIPYEGEDFEKVFVNLFLALNFAEMGNIEEALVEARKVDLKLNQYSRKYEGKNVYKQDAFVRYIMGMLYEAAGEVNDAFISYKKAYEGYKMYDSQFKTTCPSFLKADLVRTAALLRFDEDRRRFENEFNIRYTRPKKKEGSVVMVIHSGRGPIKEENKIKVTIPDNDAVLHTFTVALPKFISRERKQAAYDVEVGSKSAPLQKTPAELGEHVTEIARKSLDDRIGLVYLKAGGRALLKFLASEAAKKEWKKDGDETGNFFKSLLVDIAVDATEQADVRTWRTLPNQMFLVRVNLPPGTHNFTLTGRNPHRDLLADQVTVKEGKIVFRLFVDVN
jgi:uncharacterized protein